MSNQTARHENALAQLMTFYSALAEQEIHCWLSQSVIATLVDVYATEAHPERFNFILLLTKVLDVVFREEYDESETCHTFELRRTLAEGRRVYYIVLFKRQRARVWIDMVIPNPREASAL